MLAEPMVVILTVRNRSRTACMLVRYYVWDNMIVELSETPEGQSRLAMRVSPQSQQFIVERSQASAVAAFINEAVSELAPAKEPVP